MSRVVVNINLTLDGVMQSPSHPDEDRRGGFDQGGWAPPFFDSVMADAAADGPARTKAAGAVTPMAGSVAARRPSRTPMSGSTRLNAARPRTPARPKTRASRP